MTVFVDASFLIALFNRDDEFHQKANRLSKKLKETSSQLITSNIALAESVNLTFRHLGPKKARKALEVFQESGLEIIFVSREIFDKAYQLLFAQKSKRDLGLFDCLHLATMESLGIKTILSFDKRFKKEVKVID
ncbi:PIN domain-containing protein [Candidatus Gottesmanbacteria bacterium]|nr:PIN domain-containing protein [Candidatus Gottesmanbacteria bacterium]